MIYFSPACYEWLFRVGLTALGVAGTIWSATKTCKTQMFGAKYDPLHQPIQGSALLENWHTGSLTVSGATHQARGQVLLHSKITSGPERLHNTIVAQHASKAPHQIGQVLSV